MSSRLCQLFKTVITATVFVVLVGFNYHNQSIAQKPVKLSAWLVYWDLAAGEKEWAKIGSKVDKISYFAAYFDQNDCLFIPPELSEQKAKQAKKRRKYEAYLTFVNDKQNSDNLIVMKDIEVLRRLFANDALVEKHIDEIIALTLQHGYDGIEIDYERIWREENIGQSFQQFVGKLYEKACKHNLKVRIVLEPGTPFATTDFVQGPEYVVMLYNLYGLHSEPGPKANREFIQKTISQMKSLPGEKTAALATGGCLWGDNGEKRFLTEVEARTLAMVYDAKKDRDQESQCVVFAYQANGVSYVVWYADAITLNYWMLLAQEQGINAVSLWRLGENVDINLI